MHKFIKLLQLSNVKRNSLSSAERKRSLYYKEHQHRKGYVTKLWRFFTKKIKRRVKILEYNFKRGKKLPHVLYSSKHSLTWIATRADNLTSSSSVSFSEALLLRTAFWTSFIASPALCLADNPSSKCNCIKTIKGYKDKQSLSTGNVRSHTKIQAFFIGIKNIWKDPCIQIFSFSFLQELIEQFLLTLYHIKHTDILTSTLPEKQNSKWKGGREVKINTSWRGKEKLSLRFGIFTL